VPPLVLVRPPVVDAPPVDEMPPLARPPLVAAPPVVASPPLVVSPPLARPPMVGAAPASPVEPPASLAPEVPEGLLSSRPHERGNAVMRLAAISQWGSFEIEVGVEMGLEVEIRLRRDTCVPFKVYW
jgi:hypothetical protein